MGGGEVSKQFSIRISKQDNRFSSAHFTVLGERREPLHGHNYEVSVELNGFLTDEGYVLDFAEAAAILKEICKSLDHKMIVPTQNPALRIDRGKDWVEISFRQESFRFPAADVLLLPISNATAELFSEHICRLVVEAIKARGYENVAEVGVTVEEAGGQAASCRRRVRC